MDLTILGGGGWFTAHGRHTACALIRHRDGAVLIDAGTGIARLVENPELLAGVQRLDVILTHFHLDHIVGLAGLPAAGARAETNVWGPGESLYGSSTAELLGTILVEPFHPFSLQERNIDVRELGLGETEIAGVRVRARRQDRHSVPTLGLRFEDALGWVTDTAHDPESATFVAGCRVLAHEAWFTSGAPRNPDVHSSGAQAAQVARDAGIDQLLLIHIPPFERDASALTGEARATVPATELAEDHLHLNLGA